VNRTPERTTLKVTTPIDHPVFQGHYPGLPLVPGAYLLDIVAKALPARLALVEVEQCRFVGPAFPGEEIVAELSTDAERVSADLTSAGRPCAQIRFRAQVSAPSEVPTAPTDHLPVLLDPSVIAAVVPHRPPILLVDQVSDLLPGVRATVHHTVPTDPLWLEPVDDALPRGMILESWAQAALVMLLAERPHPDVLGGGVPVAGTLDRVVFGPRVRRGMRLDHEVVLTRNLAGMSIVRGCTRVNGVPVLRIGRLVATLAPVEQLRAAS